MAMRVTVLEAGYLRVSTLGQEPLDTTPPCIIVDGASATVYATVAELIAAETGGIAAGYYEATSAGLRVYYDGVDFLDPLGTVVSLSPVMDHIADVKGWWRQGSKITSNGGVAASGDTLLGWAAAHPVGVSAVVSSSTIGFSTINASDAINPANVNRLVTEDSADYSISAPFEVFSAIQMNTAVDINAGIAGTWTGAAGWILIAADFAAPYGALFGFSGTYARASSRLDTNPHVVSGRYDGSNVIVSVDGVDVGTAAKTGTADGGALYIGAFDGGGVTNMDGKIAELAIIKKSLTVDERAAIVADMLARISP
jgi:hypothetical protein